MYGLINAITGHNATESIAMFTLYHDPLPDSYLLHCV